MFDRTEEPNLVDNNKDAAHLQIGLILKDVKILVNQFAKSNEKSTLRAGTQTKWPVIINCDYLQSDTKTSGL